MISNMSPRQRSLLDNRIGIVATEGAPIPDRWEYVNKSNVTGGQRRELTFILPIALEAFPWSQTGKGIGQRHGQLWQLFWARYAQFVRIAESEVLSLTGDEERMESLRVSFCNLLKHLSNRNWAIPKFFMTRFFGARLRGLGPAWQISTENFEQELHYFKLVCHLTNHGEMVNKHLCMKVALYNVAQNNAEVYDAVYGFGEAASKAEGRGILQRACRLASRLARGEAVMDVALPSPERFVDLNDTSTSALGWLLRERGLPRPNTSNLSSALGELHRSLGMEEVQFGMAAIYRAFAIGPREGGRACCIRADPLFHGRPRFDHIMVQEPYVEGGQKEEKIMEVRAILSYKVYCQGRDGIETQALRVVFGLLFEDLGLSPGETNRLTGDSETPARAVRMATAHDGSPLWVAYPLSFVDKKVLLVRRFKGGNPISQRILLRRTGEFE